MQTAMQQLIIELKHVEEWPMMSGIIKRAEELLEKEKEQMLNFYMWMRMNENAEVYFHYSDEDMFTEYLNQ
jgi:hypothetical protein